MPTSNHPHDERLSALAARDDDAVADGPLVAHVDACDRCASLVAELGVLRASLSQLPDVAPDRPLRLLPPVPDAVPPASDRVTGWIRRLFTPVLAAGATLAMVGLVGTAAPALEGVASGQDAGAALEQIGAEADDMEGARDGGGAPGEDEGPGIMSASEDPDVEQRGTDSGVAATELPAERSPWPMVLFTGIAVVIGAAVLRWILLPRAG